MTYYRDEAPRYARRAPARVMTRSAEPRQPAFVVNPMSRGKVTISLDTDLARVIAALIHEVGCEPNEAVEDFGAQLGAITTRHESFSIFVERVNASLFPDLASDLAGLIHEVGCPNAAVMAFAHHLRNVVDGRSTRRYDEREAPAEYEDEGDFMDEKDIDPRVDVRPAPRGYVNPE